MAAVYCRNCGNEIPNDSAYFVIPERGVFLCSSECRETYAKREQQKEDREFLYNLIQVYYNKKFPTPQMLAEIKRFKDKNGITYRNQAAILYYVHRVKGISPFSESLFVIERYKDEAADWYKNNKVKDTQELQKEKENPNMPRVVIPKNDLTHKRRTTLRTINAEDV